MNTGRGGDMQPVFMELGVMHVDCSWECRLESGGHEAGRGPCAWTHPCIKWYEVHLLSLKDYDRGKKNLKHTFLDSTSRRLNKM